MPSAAHDAAHDTEINSLKTPQDVQVMIINQLRESYTAVAHAQSQNEDPRRLAIKLCCDLAAVSLLTGADFNNDKRTIDIFWTIASDLLRRVKDAGELMQQGLSAEEAVDRVTA